MLKPEQVPDEVRKAAYDAWWQENSRWEDVAAAAINAWPGMRVVLNGLHPPRVTLPLPQENPDAET